MIMCDMPKRQQSFNEMEMNQLYLGLSPHDNEMLELWTSFSVRDGKPVPALMAVMHVDALPPTCGYLADERRDLLDAEMNSGKLVRLRADYSFLPDVGDDIEDYADQA